MREDYTHIAIILDRSGSMSSIRNDVVGGFNKFLEDQQKVPGRCTVTLVQFDTANPYEIMRDMEDIKAVQPLGDDYAPRGGTPLYDAIGRGIVNTGEKLRTLAEGDRPGKVIFVILTDGEENSSKEYTKDKIALMTKEQTDKYKWQFVYLGANQDAMAVGQGVGLLRAQSAGYTPTSTPIAVNFASFNVAKYRSSGDSADLNFSDEQREAMNKE